MSEGKYSASVISYGDYSQNKMEIEKRVSPAYIVRVQLKDRPGESHVYPVFRTSEHEYSFVDNSGVERKLAQTIPQFIEDNKVVEVICLHVSDVKLEDLCYTGK